MGFTEITVQPPMTDPIAIIGMSCRFPGGANSPDEFWKILANGIDVIGDIPLSRWDKLAYYDPDGNAPGKMHTIRGGFMDLAVDRFDPSFFNISPKEVTAMDPQQRILLELSWEALEDAGINPETLRGGDTGVFIGVSTTDYANFCIHDNIDRVNSYSLTGNCYSALAGRISFILGLEGPSMAIDTACSSSLVSIDNACAYLRLRKTGLALAGGFNLMLSPDMQICLTKLQALSPDGLCRSFDAEANGYVRSEGGGVVILKRLADALAAGDRVLGVIRGSFVNQDGQSTGISAPNGKSQERVIQSALKEAGVSGGQIDYIEAHGTGTRVGDKTEITAIGNVMKRFRDHASPVLIGSVKSNIGHLEAASGMAGLQKVILSLKHGIIPGNLHFATPNPGIDWKKFPLRVVDKNIPWTSNGKPRMAGVSSYGFVGTNAHLILEEPPVAKVAPSLPSRPFHTLLLSARNPEALKNLIGRYIAFLKDADEGRLADICHTAATGRAHFEFRAAVHGRDLGDFVDGLKELLEKNAFPRIGKDRRIVFLYTGQGSQYYGMGRQLYQSQPVFRKALDECERVFREIDDASLLEMMYAEGADPEKTNHTRYAQPLIFAVEYALTQLWLSWGVKPAATAGHSVGEYMAACLAGVIGFEDALRLVTIRGRLMGAVPGTGRMVAIFASRAEVEPLLSGAQGRAVIAVLNAPDQIVVGGFDDAIGSLVERLKDRHMNHQLLNVSHAFHSPQMDPVLEEFERAFSGIPLHEPLIPLISNTTAAAAPAGLLTDPAYWVRHLRQAVRMDESLAFLDKKGYSIFLEIGPAPILLAFAKRCIDHPLVLVGSMKRRVPDLLTLSESVGILYQAGIDLDWNCYDEPFCARKVSLPTYPFSSGQQRYWVDGPARPLSAAKQDESAMPISGESHPLIGRRMETGALPGTVWFEMDIARGRHYFFAEHVIMGVETAPAAALLSWVWLAARQLFPGEPFRMEEITLTQPLILYDRDRIGQIIVRDVEARRCAFEFVSREAGSAMEPWTTHAKGWIVRGELPPTDSIPLPDLQEMESRCDFRLSGEDFYDCMESLGYRYGSLFRRIRQAAGAADEILCHWSSPARNTQTEDYWITPGDLDTLFQSPAVALLKDPAVLPDAGKIHIPFYIRGIVFFRPLVPGQYCVYTRSRANVENSSRSVESVMTVLDERLRLCAVIDGFVSAAVSKQMLLREERLKRLHRLTYEEEWKPQPLPAPAGREDRPGKTWILFGDRHAACASLAQRLADHGRVCVVQTGSRFEELGQDRYGIDGGRPDDYAALFAHLHLDPREGVGVIHMRLGDASPLGRTTTVPFQEEVGDPLRRLLYLTQTLLTMAFPSRLYIVTSGNRHVQDEDDTALLRSPGIDGFASVAQLEHPEHRVTHIDLSPFPEEEEIGRLADELLADSAEMRVCLRRDRRHVARLVHWRSREAQEDEGMPLPEEPYTLESGGGGLDDMRLAGIDRKDPGPQEVEFEVIASGVNFKDVLRALGELKHSANRIGGEAAGIVTRVGSQVKGIKPGDAIMSRDIAGGGFSSHLIAREKFISLKPECLTFEEASTVSISFMTAYYGLFDLGKLKKGERVLIHAGAGGVGLAAVQLALAGGAEVFSTAGSGRKRAFLREMGVPHVLNSRTVDFGKQIRELTGGQGVHLILNALTGDFLKQSLLVLAERGRFIELGKREIWTLEQVRAVHPTASYQAFDLTDVIEGSPHGRKDILDAVIRAFVQGSIRPLPVHVFPIQKANRAFRFMSQARHIGRIALSHRRALREKVVKSEIPLRQDGAYVITGGMGGLGMEIASRMAAHPVGTIVLVGRRLPTGDTLAKIEAMKRAGADVLVMQCDVSDREECDRLFERIGALPRPLRGIVHAAGVLEDRTIAQQNWDLFAAALAPKVQGTWNLHEATQNRPLDFFVMFSSVAATIGNRGQSNYAAGNAFMNALARYRRALGLCANSICWGPWAEVGMAASGNQPGLRMARQGILGIKLSEGVSAMFSIIQKDLAMPTVLNMNWELFLDTVPEGLANTYFEKIKAGRTGTAALSAKCEEKAEAGNPFPPPQQIKEACPQDRPPLVLALIRKVVGRVMGYEEMAMVPTDVSLTRMGLDSLMAMDFRSQLEKCLSITLPFSFLSDHSTLEDIAAHILKEMKE